MNSRKFTKEEIETFVKESLSIADVCRKCGWKPTGANYKTVKNYFKEYDINISHFTGQRSNIGNKHNKHNEKNANEYLNKDYVSISTNILKYKLVKDGYKQYRCECCGLTKWNGKQISLQLHHINGDNTDNRLENLQLLCPNCHSQTDNYCGNINENNKKYYCKSCGKVIEKTKTRLCDDCYNKLIENQDIVFQLNPKETTIYGYCKKCGAELHSKTKHNMCSTCVKKYVLCKVKNKPTTEELLKLLETNSYESVGRMYGVSGNAIKKWLKN